MIDRKDPWDRFNVLDDRETARLVKPMFLSTLAERTTKISGTSEWTDELFFVEEAKIETTIIQSKR